MTVNEHKYRRYRYFMIMSTLNITVYSIYLIVTKHTIILIPA